jgi:hypothetical protein
MFSPKVKEALVPFIYSLLNPEEDWQLLDEDDAILFDEDDEDDDTVIDGWEC